MIDPIARLLGTWSEEINIGSILFRILLSIALSAIVGCERSSKRHAAGFRTFILVSFSSTLAIMLDVYLSKVTGTTFCLISAASVIAIAIISSGSTLYTSRNQIKGLTTSVALFGCGIIGLTLGAGFYTVTLIAFVALLICLSVFPAIETYLKNRSNHFELHLELKSASFLPDFVQTIRKLGIRIDDIELNPAYAGSGISVYSIAVSIESKELKKYKEHREIIEALRSLEYILHIEEMN